MGNHTNTAPEATPEAMSLADAKDALSDIESIANGLSELFAIMNEASGHGISPESDGTFFVLGTLADEIYDKAAKVADLIQPLETQCSQAETIGA